MNIQGLEAIATQEGTRRDQQKVRDAAKEFEALLIEQMLRAARAGGSGEWMGEDQTGSALSEMAEQQFARALSAGGGLGLAKLVVEGLDANRQQ